MGRVEDMLDNIINEDGGYQMRNERTVTEEEKRLYEYVDSMSEEQIKSLERKINLRKERLERDKNNKDNKPDWW